jgi:hypothetical protein
MRGNFERINPDGSGVDSQGGVFVRVTQDANGKVTYTIDGPTSAMVEHKEYPKGGSYSLEALEAAGLYVERVYAPSKK